MKLPIIEAIRTARTGNVVPLTRRVSATFNLEDVSSDVRGDRAYEFKTEAAFAFVQYADDEKAVPHLEKLAKRVLMTELYGPVVERLHELLHMAWEEPLPYDSKIVAAIEALLNDLRD